MAPNAMDVMVGRGPSKQDVRALDVQLHEQPSDRRQPSRFEMAMEPALLAHECHPMLSRPWAKATLPNPRASLHWSLLG